MKKITIFIEDNVPEDTIQPFIPQVVSQMISNGLRDLSYSEGFNEGFRRKEQLKVIEFVNANEFLGFLDKGEKGHFGDGCDCGDNCNCNNDDKCDDDCKCNDKNKVDKSSKL